MRCRGVADGAIGQASLLSKTTSWPQQSGGEGMTMGDS